MTELFTRDYGWVFAFYVVAVATVAIGVGLMVIRETWADLRSLRASGQNGILEGLTLVSLKASIIRVAQLGFFCAAGYIVLGVVIAGAPPEGALLSFSRLMTAGNVTLTAWFLVWGRSARRHLAEKEAERRDAEEAAQ